MRSALTMPVGKQFEGSTMTMCTLTTQTGCLPSGLDLLCQPSLALKTILVAHNFQCYAPVVPAHAPTRHLYALVRSFTL